MLELIERSVEKLWLGDWPVQFIWHNNVWYRRTLCLSCFNESAISGFEHHFSKEYAINNAIVLFYYYYYYIISFFYDFFKFLMVRRRVHVMWCDNERCFKLLFLFFLWHLQIYSLDFYTSFSLFFCRIFIQ